MTPKMKRRTLLPRSLALAYECSCVLNAGNENDKHKTPSETPNLLPLDLSALATRFQAYSST